MIALLWCVSAWAGPARVSLGPTLGTTGPAEPSAALSWSLERQMAPRLNLGVGGRAFGQPLSWALEPITGPDLQYTGQSLFERSAWWAGAEWRAAGVQRGQFDLGLGIDAGVGARRIQAGDWAELPTLADVILPPDWGYSQQLMAQSGLSLRAVRGHWGLEISAQGELSTLPPHLRGKVSPWSLWGKAAVVFTL